MKTVQLLLNPLDRKLRCLKLLIQVWNICVMIVTNARQGQDEKSAQNISLKTRMKEVTFWETWAETGV
jgi:hypothetical protein